MTSYNPPPQTGYTTQHLYQPPPSNGLGIAGFVVSLAGLVVCAGLLSPIGVVMSLIALGKEPRGFAIAGTIVGVIGSLLGATILLMAFGVIGSSWALFNMFGPQMTTQNNMYTASNDIDSYYSSNNDTLPDAATGTLLIANYVDGYGNPMEYRPQPGSKDMYELVSAGADGVFGNTDDYVEPMQAYNWSTGFTTMPQQATPAQQQGPDPSQIEFSFDQAGQAIDKGFAPGSTLPTQAQGTALIAGLQDAWGRPLRYSPSGNPPYYHLKSAGPDGEWGNEDDVVKSLYFQPSGG